MWNPSRFNGVDVIFISPEGEAVLSRLWRQGVTLRSTGCFTSSLIEEMAGEDRSSHPCVPEIDRVDYRDLNNALYNSKGCSTVP